MMRALWSAASGMKSQQTNVDVIANNLANVNTTSYKTESAQFKSLLYQTIQNVTTSNNGETKPVGAQVGLGTRTGSISSIFTQGSFSETGLTTDFAISGEGFFMLQSEDGETIYTRNGNFLWSLSENGVMLTTQAGLPVLDTNGDPIEFDTDEYSTSNITIDADGNICYPDETGNLQNLGIQIGIAQFANPSGLEKIGSTNYAVTEASGEAILESENDNLEKSVIRQGYLEASNVNVADEMVDLIIAQRAYEMNSKAIQAADDMLSQANQLRR